MSEGGERSRPTVHDVAREAGVSLATVDRVLNGRPGVRPATATKVEQAIAALDFQRDLSASLLARSRDLRLQFLIPGGANEFMDSLEASIDRFRRAGRAERLHIETTRIPPLDPQALAARLDQLSRRNCDCAVIVAADSPQVRRSVEAASRQGVEVMTLVSDLPGSSRRQFIGIDNRAAGRTAASLLGRFCTRGATVAVMAGSLGLRDHAERVEGFQAVLGTEFRQIRVLGPLEHHDDGAEAELLTRRLLDQHPDLAGIYNTGAGNRGLIAALQASSRAGQVRAIVHELTAPTRAGLVAGSIDVVLDQNPDAEIRQAVAAARSLAQSPTTSPETGPIEISIFLRDNLR